MRQSVKLPRGLKGLPSLLNSAGSERGASLGHSRSVLILEFGFAFDLSFDFKLGFRHAPNFNQRNHLIRSNMFPTWQASKCRRRRLMLEKYAHAHSSSEPSGRKKGSRGVGHCVGQLPLPWSNYTEKPSRACQACRDKRRKVRTYAMSHVSYPLSSRSSIADAVGL